MTKKKTPASSKTKTAKKPARKRATARRKPTPKGQRSWLKMLWGVTWKLGLAGFALLLFVGIYLDSVVKQRFEGQLFDLPTVVYARILNLSPGDSISIQEVRNELDVLNYRKVRQPRYPVSIRRRQPKLN